MGGRRGRLIALKDRKRAIELVREALLLGCRKRVACEDLDVSLRTLERWEKCPGGDQRQGPKTQPANKLSSEERRSVIELLTSKDYLDLPPSQVVPILADKGIYLASEATMYRILKQERLATQRGKSRSRKHKRPEPFVATGPNQVWSWDITYLQTTIRGRFFYLYVAMDIFSRKITGWQVFERENSENAAIMIEAACKIEGISKQSLVLHSDNGSPMKGATMLATLQRLGVMPSFSRPSVSDDNPYSEALFKTVKYHPSYPLRPFESILQASDWVSGFVNWYNNTHRHSGIKFVSPAQRHSHADSALLRKREEVYAKAKESRPERWTGQTRNWEPETEVYLNPLHRRKDYRIGEKPAA